MSSAETTPSFLARCVPSSCSSTFAVERSLFAVGVFLYCRATRAADRTGRWALIGFLLFLLLFYIPAPFSPPPPSVRAVAAVNASLALMLLWAAWLDRHWVARSTNHG